VSVRVFQGQQTCHDVKPLFSEESRARDERQRAENGDYFARTRGFPRCEILPIAREDFRGNRRGRLSTTQNVSKSMQVCRHAACLLCRCVTRAGGQVMTARTLECDQWREAGLTARDADWIRLIRAEYLEFPGLSLTEPQAQRLWNLDRDACQCVLEALVRQKFLRRTANAQYVRADWCRAGDLYV
jgi:hypothetical protein